MKKFFIALALSLVLIVGLGAVCVFASASGTCGDNLTWVLDDEGTLTISGSGDMENFSSNGSPWYSNCNDIKEVILEKGITSVGVLAFEDCSKLVDIILPDSIEYIGSAAFMRCSSLSGIIIPSGVDRISSSAFLLCSELESITIPLSVKSIGSCAFESCYQLGTVYYEGGEEDWKNISIDKRDGDKNYYIRNASIYYNSAVPKTYIFITNGGTIVEPITGEISEEPVTERDGYDFIGWYDNEDFTGEMITFPYSGEATTLYARWWPVGEEVRNLDYTINSIALRDISTNNEIEAIPEGGFVAEVKVTNISSEKVDVVIIAAYDKDGILIDMDFAYADLEIGEDITFGSLISNTNGEVYSVKVFVRPWINSLVPLAESREILK